MISCSTAVRASSRFTFIHGARQALCQFFQPVKPLLRPDEALLGSGEILLKLRLLPGDERESVLHFLTSHVVSFFVAFRVRIAEKRWSRLRAIELDFDLASAPDPRAVLPDGTVRGKLPRARRVEDGHPPPALRIAVGLANAILAIDVGLVVG